MTELIELLSVGDRRTTGKVPVVMARVRARPELFAELVTALAHGDAGVRMRAADAMEKITRQHPEWVLPHKRGLLALAVNATQAELRWHLAQVLPRLTLTGSERAKVVALLRGYLGDHSRIVKTCAMQALVDIALVDRRYLAEVRELIERLTAQGSPAMRARGRKLLTLIAAA